MTNKNNEKQSALKTVGITASKVLGKMIIVFSTVVAASAVAITGKVVAGKIWKEGFAISDSIKL